ncbi:DUF4436 domain-containing protein [Mycobacterium szulgai]|uniref:DUF4436 domain-containing protein n=1 Tax=Mycobacterium szulgai TaxID=1787 RepID=UPI000A1F167F|nr:DUF4436 domain-containing protein [Mycobacterium szulgai]MCV7079850.1 DUF4436 domain-containing protein [Mycobacterium szulgai]
MTTQPPSPPPAPTGEARAHARRVAIGLAILVGVVVVYTLSLVAVHLLAKSAPALPPVDLSKHEAEDTIVQVRLDDLKTVANRLKVNVLVYPKDSLYDKDFGVLTTNAAVRLYPENDLGDLQYPVGKAPAQVATTIVAHGDPGNWPFDSYKTEVIAADVFTGSGQSREKVNGRIEVSGSLDGWDATVTRVHDPDEQDPDVKDDVVITLQRSKSSLIFDVGICLVLLALPALALWVAIPMALGRTSFLPPFATWYAAMLFAIVPLRNIFPGSPPPGSWIDQAFVLWVLIALVVAMFLFVVAWSRQRDRKPPG